MLGKISVIWAFLLLVGLMHAEFCVPDVTSISVDITVREHSGGGVPYSELMTETLHYGEHIDLYNNTQIYFYGYTLSEDICSSSCGKYYPEEFTASLMVLTTTSYYHYKKLGDLEDGYISSISPTEGKYISIMVSGFDSYAICELDDDHDGEEYCDDFTLLGYCSVTPPYKCEQVQVGWYPAEYGAQLEESNKCDNYPWGEEITNCVDDYSTLICSDREVQKKTCVNGAWEYELVENCSLQELFCKDEECVIFELSGFNGCSDGTIANTCSVNTPYFCTLDGVLIVSPRICGCPQHAIYDILTDSCLYKKCPDGTELASCSDDKPYYCYTDGSLVEKASLCGCPEGYEISGDECVQPTEEEPIVEPEPVVEQPPEEPEEGTEPVVEEEPEPATIIEEPESQEELQSEEQAEDEEPVQVEAESDEISIPKDALYIGAIVVFAGAAVYFYLSKGKK